MKPTLFVLVLVALAAAWVVEKSSAARLASEIETHRMQQREFARLQRERDRLRALLPSAEELETLSRDAAEHARVQHEIDLQTTKHAAPMPTLPVGEWTSAGDWKSRGQATPHATVETALWAAAGGDVAALKSLFSLPVETRTQAEALFAGLPATSRALYASPEDLIAAFTIKNIPVGEAQVVWFNETGPDDATVGLFLKNPPNPPESATPASTPAAPADPRDRPPPTLRADGRTAEAFLSLHRDGEVWRLVVPPSAVNKIAKELTATASR